MKLVHEATSSASPNWDAGSASLLWTDGATVHRLHPGSGTHTETVVPQPVGAALPRTNGGLVVNLRDGVGLRDVDDRLTWLVYWHRDGAEPGPAAIDPAGNIWAVTGDQLIRVRPDGRPAVVLKNVTITGLAAVSLEDVTAQGERMHIATSHGVDLFDLDTGARTPLHTAPAAGMCIDADGCTWIAVPDANEIRRVTPTGDIDRVLKVPDPTGCCFGGPDFTDLYITAGAVFVVPGIGTGTPTARFPG